MDEFAANSWGEAATICDLHHGGEVFDRALLLFDNHLITKRRLLCHLPCYLVPKNYGLTQSRQHANVRWFPMNGDRYIPCSDHVSSDIFRVCKMGQ